MGAGLETGKVFRKNKKTAVGRTEQGKGGREAKGEKTAGE